MICSCPVGTSIADLTAYTCPSDVREIQKIAFWRTGNHIDTVALLITLATWTTNKTAADSTHVVITPFLNNPRWEGGDVITYGGGTETRNGNPEVVGMNPTKFTINGLHWSSAMKREFKDMMCEQLDVIFITNEGKFIHTLATGGIIVEGFPIQSFYISDRKPGNRITPDIFEISFTLAEGWDDYLTITDPSANFNALTL